MRRSTKWRLDVETQQDLDAYVQPSTIKLIWQCDPIVEMFAKLVCEKVRGLHIITNHNRATFYIADPADYQFEEDTLCRCHIELMHGALYVSQSFRARPKKCYVLASPNTDPDAIVLDILKLLKPSYEIGRNSNV